MSLQKSNFLGESEAEWYDVLAKLRALWTQFQTESADLESSRRYIAGNEDLEYSYADLKNRKLTAENTVKSIVSQVEGAYSWVKSAFGFAGVQNQPLGFLPAVPITIAAGAVLLLTKWILDKQAYDKKVETYRLMSEKVGPIKAAEAWATMTESEKSAGAGIAEAAGGISKALLAAAALVGVYLFTKAA